MLSIYHITSGVPSEVYFFLNSLIYFSFVHVTSITVLPPSNCANPETGILKKRKRKRQEEKWQVNIKKVKRERGLGYVSKQEV